MESPEQWFHRRATLYVEAQILFHLSQVGVLELLRSGEARSAEEIAAALDLESRTTDALLDYVLGVDELLRRDAEGRYSLSEFGAEVVQRFGRPRQNGQPAGINMFDVRVGAYGPVWRNLDGMLTGRRRYGEAFHRDGQFAEHGVFKLALNFWNGLSEQIDELKVERIVEVGLTTGLLEKLGERDPHYLLYGIDRNAAALRASGERASRMQLGNIRWLLADFFAIDSWARDVDAMAPGLIFSLHFHELLADGEERLIAALRKLRELLPGWSLLAFEQPRLQLSDRAEVSETQWLYAQSNVLIHHLIGNGRILSREQWLELGHRAGCRAVTDRPIAYLGYRAFRYEL